MKKRLLQIVLAVSCVLFSSGVDAQNWITPTIGTGNGCNGTVNIVNNSGDDWIIGYYGNFIIVNAGDNQTLGFINANVGLDRGVALLTNPPCNHTFIFNPDVWNALCAANTNSVTFVGVPGIIPGCFTNGVISID